MRYKHSAYICRNKNEKHLEIMKSIEFTIEGTNEWGWFTSTRTVLLRAPRNPFDFLLASSLSNEEVFRFCWKTLSKRLELLKGWESISFVNEGETIKIFRHLLIETNFDFSQSHTIN